jgi:MSHA pilin protein MshC
MTMGTSLIRIARSSSRGFTLVELVTAIIIVGILSAVAVPRMFDSQAFQERGYVDEVAAAIRYSQKIAVASGCEVSVSLNAAAYSANQRSNFNNCVNRIGAWTTPVRRSDGGALAGTAPPNVAMVPAATFVFDDTGRVTTNPPVFTVGAFTLTVNPVSGIVTVLP